MADAMKRGRPDAMKRGRPCLILVRRRHEPLDILQREVVVFKQTLQEFLVLLYRKRNIDLLATHFARKRNLFVKKQGIKITRCTLAGLMGRADPANAITWKNFSPVSRDPGTAIPRSRLTGLARLSCNREVDFCCV